MGDSHGNFYIIRLINHCVQHIEFFLIANIRLNLEVFLGFRNGVVYFSSMWWLTLSKALDKWFVLLRLVWKFLHDSQTVYLLVSDVSLGKIWYVFWLPFQSLKYRCYCNWPIIRSIFYISFFKYRYYLRLIQMIWQSSLCEATVYNFYWSLRNPLLTSLIILELTPSKSLVFEVFRDYLL